MTSSWFFLSTLNYDARSTTHKINHYVEGINSSHQESDRLDSSPYKQPLAHYEDKTFGIQSRSCRSGDEERNFLPAPSPTTDIQTAALSFY